mgnify:CR=1 FL=1
MGLINSLFSRNDVNNEIEILQDVQIKQKIKEDNETKPKKIFSRKEISFLVDDAISEFNTIYLSPSGFMKKKNFKIFHESPESPDFVLEPPKVK